MNESNMMISNLECTKGGNLVKLFATQIFQPLDRFNFTFDIPLQGMVTNLQLPVTETEKQTPITNEGR